MALHTALPNGSMHQSSGSGGDDGGQCASRNELEKEKENLHSVLCTTHTQVMPGIAPKVVALV